MSETKTEKQVTCATKDEDGDITWIGGAGWSVSKSRAIKNIEAGTTRYYVEEESPKAYIHVAGRAPNQYLRTAADATSKNNLDNLDDC